MTDLVTATQAIITPPYRHSKIDLDNLPPSLLRPSLNALKIMHKQKLEIVPFILNAPQEYYLSRIEKQLAETKRVRAIILKARQMGFSTVTEAIAFLWSFMIPSMRAEIMAHENDASANLLALTTRFWNNWWAKELYTPKNLASNRLSWYETDSQIHISTASGKGGGRSSTIHVLHASEVAFWPNASETYLALRQSVPDTDKTIIILESTANGVGNFFHQQWIEANDKTGDSEFEPLFFAWFEDPTYRASVAGIDVHLGNKSEEERVLQKAFGVDDDQLKWRRWAITNKAKKDVLKFAQEYPATPEEAFLSTGSNQFPLRVLRRIYRPVSPDVGRIIDTPRGMRFVRDPTGQVELYVYPPGYDPSTGYFRRDPVNSYFIGADTCRSRVGDYAVAQVINRHTYEQVAKLRGRILPADMGREMLKLGQFFGNATIAPEKANEGHLSIGVLLGAHYPHVWIHEKIDSIRGKPTLDNYGWDTNVQTKPQMIGLLQDYVFAGYSPATRTGLIIHDPQTYKEMVFYVRHDNGAYGPSDEDTGGHDDCVDALAIALICNYLDPLPDRQIGSNSMSTPRLKHIADAATLDKELAQLLHDSGINLDSGVSR